MEGLLFVKKKNLVGIEDNPMQVGGLRPRHAFLTTTNRAFAITIDRDMN
jgi:hypothetical protein